MTEPKIRAGGFADEPHELVAEIAARLEEGEPVDWEALARAHPELADELERLRAGWQRVALLLDRFGLDGRGPAWELDTQAPAARAVLAALARRRGIEPRLRIDGELARGGMARVLRAFDLDLRRPVAMKVCGEPGGPAPTGGSAGLVHRFVDEAQITGQLAHPGVVPVYELGLDEQGRLYFTMELVEGRTLSEVIGLARRGLEGWTRARALEVVLKVCDALAFAHSRGVIHRDLKPANVMVGRFGEVRVMDWGLAGTVGAASGPPLSTLRGEARSSDKDSGLLTAAGDVVGTPAYMPPEQAEGRVRELDARSDVYALGAILYELLAGRAPYGGGRSSREEVIGSVRRGPPELLAACAPEAPAELVAICEQAMARVPSDRYADMSAVAEDLRRYQEGRVVRAHGSGPWITARKWARRNRALAAGVGLALAGALVGGLLWVRSESRRKAELEDLALVAYVEDLEARADALSPAYPALVPELERWLVEAEEVAARGPAIERELELLRARADAAARAGPAAPHPRAPELEGLRLQLEVLDAGHHGLAAAAAVRGARADATAVAERARLVQAIAALELELEHEAQRAFWFASDQVRHDALARLVQDLRRLADPDRHRGTIANVRWRLEQARTLAGRSIEAYSARWGEARASIADPELCPMYAGLALEPQTGLVPLGPDPASGLWEFADVQTGTLPARAADGRLEFGAGNGLVFVLIPGGVARLGSRLPEEARPGEPHLDPFTLPERESPPPGVPLEPYFLSKYEMTQGQWLRWTGTNPSHYVAGRRQLDGFETTLLCPVEKVDWPTCEHVMRSLGFALPTEAQWEHAARAGTTTVRWTGDSLASLEGAENMRDKRAIRHADDRRTIEEEQFPFDDGYITVAPVGSFRPNPWGLHDVLGNVSERCADLFYLDPRWPRRPGDGLLRAPEDQGERSVRGGYFGNGEHAVRSSFRATAFLAERTMATGVRPARAIER